MKQNDSTPIHEEKLPPIAAHFSLVLQQAEWDRRMAAGLCPQCGEDALQHSSGCSVCENCGWSACDS